jgi:hypothetical protein
MRSGCSGGVETDAGRGVSRPACVGLSGPTRQRPAWPLSAANSASLRNVMTATFRVRK